MGPEKPATEPAQRSSGAEKSGAKLSSLVGPAGGSGDVGRSKLHVSTGPIGMHTDAGTRDGDRNLQLWLGKKEKNAEDDQPKGAPKRAAMYNKSFVFGRQKRR